MRTIQENRENDKILTQAFAIKVKELRYSKSNHKVCDDLGIPFISNSPDETGGASVLRSPCEGDLTELYPVNSGDAQHILNDLDAASKPSKNKKEITKEVKRGTENIKV